MHKILITYLLIVIIVLNACQSSHADACHYIDASIVEEKESVKTLEDKIESWNENSHRRMEFIQKHYQRFKGPLVNFEKALLTNDLQALSLSRKELNEVFEYLWTWIKSDQWQNIDFYWQIEEAKAKFLALEINPSEACENKKALDFYDIKADLLSTLYMMGYMDEFVFTKIEPFALLDKTKIKIGDSIRIGNYAIGYDSTRVPELIYWINDSTFNPETSTKTNNFGHYITGKKGKNKVYGILKIYQYGKVFEKKWQAEFEVE